MNIPDYSKLFVDGTTIDSEYGPVTLKQAEAGELVLTTGKIVACDPAGEDITPFTTTVTPGAYPVVLSITHFNDNDQRVAAAMLRVTERQPVRWEMAMIPEQELSLLKADEIFGYPVDSAMGCFMDEEAAKALLENEQIVDDLADELDRTYVDTWSWANARVKEGSPLNIVAFSAGMGDGLYASYFGYDEDGQIACLVTDFALFDNEAIE